MCAINSFDFFGIKTDRVIYAVVFRKRQFLVAAIDAGTASVDQMLTFVETARLEDVNEANQIALNLCVWICQGVPHAGLRGEMNDTLRLAISKNFF